MSEAETAEAATASRRVVLAGAGAACAAIVAGCSTYNANNGGVNGPAQTSAPATGGTASASGGSGGATALTTTAKVPVGGGQILTPANVVVTQPTAGSFKAFSAVCTHQGCIVGTVAGGTIDCPCHGSKFSIKDGSVVNGPATRPLPPVTIKVDGTSIVEA
jgi:Rieske Fe-S protein